MMVAKQFSIYILSTVIGVFMSFNAHSPGKKVDKIVEDVFEVENFEYQGISVPSNLNLPSKVSKDNFFKLVASGKTIGYVYMDKAPSKTAQFDYLVVFDGQLKITQTKVLVYREEYGGEIGSKRWLRQFIGKAPNDTLKDIAAISGATISVRSMTNAVDDILKTVAILQAKQII